MIWFGNVSKTYGKSGRPAVEGLQLSVERGEIFGFLGPNGAGKTTTIKMVTGILEPDAGEIEVDGISIVDHPVEAKRKIGYVPDGADPYPRLTGLEYLTFMADIHQVGADIRKQRIPEWVERFGMESAIGNLIDSYSRGMKQKISLIASMIHQPPVWILDEPMVGLDPRSSAILKEEMRRHSDRGNTVFFSTHVLEVAERLCDRLAILKEGRLVATGKLEQLRQGTGGDVADEQTLENLFLELTEG
ncbi:ABC transporter ATP-binding protein [Kroppenstedtia eburnea]|uniref:ABC-2 type transport system ATP-binding protein n=1 Tax=Kroppenstedtia eburnea TaxID=714067 RepID=A0A1N7PLK8_9BACL|nr:ABC transporter ATP-binding protein [Kroppenstedtia eburnea]QKI83822.1 ABC transporter ATP-binding protein [Kroppenstedtia eburnea]SIT11524.1 ABC-2 type transport system ATP-binding protein [Kroppenstedtia eburnea]